MKECPKCGALMQAMSEYMDSDWRYEMKWWECPHCHYCIERNFSE